MYRLTEAGRRAWKSKDVSVPSDYRVILWVMDSHGYQSLQAWLDTSFPEQHLADCLAEMAQLQLIEKTPGDIAHGQPVAEPPNPVVYSLAESYVSGASRILSRQGAFLSADRMKGRKPLTKPASETTILIVEDDPDQLALADLRVSMGGYAVRAARSQAELLVSLVDNGVPDLVLLDVALLDGNGFDILAKLRRSPSFVSLPIVMLTAKATPEHILKGLTLGADGYVTKPYTKTILLDVVTRILGSPAS
jgi:two-component system alkaline phosphatase synthesis response regulator PhoP